MASIFTKIIKRELPSSIIYEDDKHIAILTIEPFEKGHTLVIPKKEFKTISEMNKEEYLKLQEVVFKVSKHISEILTCDLNIWLNDGKKATQEVEHVHFHIVPRREFKKTYCSSNCKYLKNEMKNYQDLLKIR